MFWSGNYTAVRELNSLLSGENVTLSQVLEADDILQECKADNKALIQFLTKPEILADLITLITEEPPKNVELATQYRHANIACEVLTSQLSMLSDRLSLDAAQMNRLCDFINQDPPLNPLLASYFSKTVEMLLEKSPKQDWCLHHIVCLRVLDFFKSRRDFLPNLLRHMSTSAVADIFKCFLRIDDLIKTVMEWLEEHQFLECLIQIICGTYVAEVFPSSSAPRPEPRPEPPEKAERETSEKPHDNHTDDKDSGGEQDTDKEAPKPENSGETNDTQAAPAANSAADDSKAQAAAKVEAEAEAAARAITAERMAAAASANAAALLCDLIVNGCRPRTGWVLVSQLLSVRTVVAALQCERGVHALLQGMFTSPPRARRHALVNGTQVLLALLHHEPPQRVEKSVEEEARSTYNVGECSERSSVELAVAPHLPLLHHALLHDPAADGQGGCGGVGLARVQVAALLAHLALSEVEEVATTMLTLGTPGVLVDMFFKFPNNNFLHAQVYTLVKHALTNRVYRTQYARHLLIECDLLTRLMDAFEENKNNKGGTVPRAAHMGHAVLCLALAARALQPPDLLAHALPLPPALAERWAAFLDQQLRPLLQQHDTPLVRTHTRYLYITRCVYNGSRGAVPGAGGARAAAARPAGARAAAAARARRALGRLPRPAAAPAAAAARHAARTYTHTLLVYYTLCI
ncbi:phosphatase 6 regulatory subunit 1-like protein fmt [Anticarsia gemmatalis]|uniref:phosphatase 6 regulatory subunit 1-like protein fmt n=1 Tax=Anticarsia gemmatalis TaxID=129554 RepID=UPI003F766F2D